MHATTSAMGGRITTCLNLASMLPGHHNSPAPPNTATSSAGPSPPPPPVPSLRHLQAGSPAQAGVGGRRDGAAAHAGLQLRGARHHCASGPRRGLRQLRLRRRPVPAEAPF